MIDVLKYGTTPSGCGCPAWLYRPESRPCKHVRALTSALELVNTWLTARRGRESAGTPARSSSIG